jgi:hypothetical protein
MEMIIYEKNNYISYIDVGNFKLFLYGRRRKSNKRKRIEM